MTADRTYRYPLKVIRFAQALREEDPDRQIESIRHACGRFGPTPSYRTVRRWVDPDFALAWRLQNRVAMRRGRVKGPQNADEVLTKRFNDLRRIGVSFHSIAAIFQLDFGVDLNEERLRYAERKRSGQIRVKSRDFSFEVTA